MQKNRLFRFVEFVSRSVSLVGGVFAAVAIFLMTLLITVDVLGRYVLGESTLVAVEVSGYLLVLITFLALAYTERQKKHIRITILTSRISQRKRELLEIGILLGAVILISWLAWISFEIIVEDYTQKVTSITLLKIPMWIPRLVIPIGFGMLAVQLMVQTIETIKAMSSRKVPGETRKDRSPAE